jgi:hypothetical protein
MVLSNRCCWRTKVENSTETLHTRDSDAASTFISTSWRVPGHRTQKRYQSQAEVASAFSAVHGGWGIEHNLQKFENLLMKS